MVIVVYYLKKGMKMKTELPLPKTEKQIFVSQKTVRELDWPFYKADDIFNMRFTQNDINYINRTIKNHKLYRPLQQNRINNNHDNENLVRRYAGYINFFSMFLNDDKCPENLKRFLGAFMNLLRDFIKSENQEQALLQTQIFMNRWMEICH